MVRSALTQLTGAAAALFFRPDARPIRRATLETLAVMPGRSSVTATLLADTAVHERVSVPVAGVGALSTATPIEPPVTDSPTPLMPTDRVRSESANVSRVASSSCSPVAASPSPSRSTSTVWLVSAKLAEPVMKSKMLRLLSVPATVVCGPRRVIASAAGVGSD